MASIYLKYFGLEEAPFSITPDPRYMYLSRRHQDGLAHLLYGVGQGGSGGFVQLTGEVGTGKTTLCRCLLEQVPEDTRVALILNPMLTPRELLEAICDELEIPRGQDDGQRQLVDRINRYLLWAHAEGQRVVLVIDEAQNMSRDALEQVRLLTNLETHTDKLLQIVLLGQSELRTLLQQTDLRQLAQRITARYHLEPLDEEESRAYIRHRLSVAGTPHDLFTGPAYQALYRQSQGIPRLLNIIADRALMGAYAEGKPKATPQLVRQAAKQVRGEVIKADPSERQSSFARIALAGFAGLALITLTVMIGLKFNAKDQPDTAIAQAPQTRSAEPDNNLEAPAGGVQPSATAATTVPPLLPDQTAQADAGLPAEPAVFDLGQWLQQTDRDAVWEQFAARFDQDPASMALACSAQQGGGTAGRAGGAICLNQQGNLTRLKQLDIPVLLQLRATPESATQLYWVQLTGLDESRALLDNGTAPEQVPLDQLEQAWLGDFLVFVPLDEPAATLQQGDSGREVQAAKNLAASLADAPYAGDTNNFYDDGFAAWVKQFQIRSGLRDDGIIGPATQLYLRAQAAGMPRLQHDLTPAPAADAGATIPAAGSPSPGSQPEASDTDSSSAIEE